MKKLLTLLLLACLLAPACAMAAGFSITDQNGNPVSLDLGSDSRPLFRLSGGSTYTLSGDTALPVQLTLTGSGEVTLILSGVSISVPAQHEANLIPALHIGDALGTGSMKVKLVLADGTENMLTAVNSCALDAGVPMSVSGKGELALHTSADFYASLFSSRDISILGGTVKAENPAGTAISVNGDLTIGGNAQVIALAKSDSSDAIYADGTLTIADSAVVNASAQGVSSSGIRAITEIRIEDKAAVFAQAAGDTAFGLNTENAVRIQDTASVFADVKGEYSGGIFADSLLSLSGSASVIARVQGGSSHAVIVDDGPLSVQDSAKLNASADGESSCALNLRSSSTSSFSGSASVIAAAKGEESVGLSPGDNSRLTVGGSASFTAYADGNGMNLYDSQLDVSGGASFTALGGHIGAFLSDSGISVGDAASFVAHGGRSAILYHGRSAVTTQSSARALAGPDLKTGEWLPYEQGMIHAEVVDSAIVKWPSMPATGDSGMLAAWACLLAAALSALCVRARHGGG